MIPTLVDLAVSYPIPSSEKFNRRLARLLRIKKFYEKKAEIAQEGQSQMFIEFASAISYSIEIMEKYRSLTKKIASSNEGQS